MINPSQEQKQTSVKLGSNYEINKNLVQKVEKELTPEQKIQKKEEIKHFLNNGNKYFMLLCHERRDYTLIVLTHHRESNLNTSVEDIFECLSNRGEIRGIDVVGNAIEIWISIDNEAFCYYLFNYDNGVMEA